MMPPDDDTPLVPTVRFNPATGERKRGRPSKGELERRKAYSEYLRRLETRCEGMPPAFVYGRPSPMRQPPPDKRPARVRAQAGIAMALALALRQARKAPGGRRRLEKKKSLQFICKFKGEVAKEFGIRPEMLKEEQIYDLAVRTGRVLNPKYFRGYIFELAVKQGKLKPLTVKRKRRRKVCGLMKRRWAHNASWKCME
jgi:hypothetical protein